MTLHRCPEVKKELKLGHIGPDRGLHYWLTVEGEAIAYAKVYDSSTAQGTQISLCDIEVKESHRNRGYATELLRAIAQGHGVEEITHSGGYTPDGFAYVAKKLKRVGPPAQGPSYGAMNFVFDWKDLTILGS